MLRSALVIPDLSNTPCMSVTFDTFHFDTSGFALLAPLNAHDIVSTFDVFQVDTLGYAFFAPRKVQYI